MYKAIDRWLLPLCFKQQEKSNANEKHIFISICDHFEPFHQTNGVRKLAIEKMQRWIQSFPVVQGKSYDSIGRKPVHTFFYPIEQYDSEVVSLLEELCRNGAGEVEVHLHHNDDTSNTLSSKLQLGVENLHKHGFLSKDHYGNLRYGFIHGNWAITNSHPNQQFCGVENEIEVLVNTGCFGDYTMPSAPDKCQSKIVNSIYFAKDIAPVRSHDYGERASVSTKFLEGSLLFIQGPLNLNWNCRKFGVIPRIENADLTLANPPTIDRFKLWVKSNIHVSGKPEWIFIKLHTHGCNPKNIEMHLSGTLQQFYSELTEYCANNFKLNLYFVTAREMANLAHAAIDGIDKKPLDCMDYLYRTNL